MKYTTAAVVKLPAGSVLGLSQAQAAARRHCVRALDGRAGWYRAIDELHLKPGEPVEFDGNAPKGLWPVLLRAPAKAARAASSQAAAAAQGA
jgi:hypothetical protein